MTWRIRIVIPGLAFLFSAFSLWLVARMGGSTIRGSELYEALTWISFSCALLTSATLPADSVSGEKRDGTLGLLFLTPLRGYHIALGKFFSSAILALFSLLAVFPVLAIPLLMGGVGLKEFLFTLLALIVSTLLALSLGLFISTITVRPWKGVALALFCTSFLAAGLPAIASVVYYKMHRPVIAAYLYSFSPSYIIYSASASAWRLRFQFFWQGILFQSALCLLLLTACALLLPYVWKDRPGSRFTVRFKAALSRWRYGFGQHRRQFRARLLDINPFTWLASRHRWASAGFALFAFVLFLLPSVLSRKLIVQPGSEEEVVFPILFTCGAVALLHLGIALRIAILACDRFSTDRKSGALELLLSTPLSIKDIIRGQWLALARHLWAAILLVLLAHSFALWWIIELFELEAHAHISLKRVLQVISAHISGQSVPSPWEPLLLPFIPLIAALLLVYSWMPLGWLSMWLGLRMNVQIRAPWFAVLLIYIPPWPILGATMGLLQYSNSLPHDDLSLFLITISLATALIVMNASFWMWYSRRQLRRHFRSAATDRYSLLQKRGWFRRLLFGKPNFESVQ
jgi:ABC-type Na+ efflux pump permease subunit